MPKNQWEVDTGRGSFLVEKSDYGDNIYKVYGVAPPDAIEVEKDDFGGLKVLNSDDRKEISLARDVVEKALSGKTSSTDLKTQLIRLGSENPDLRDHLRPILGTLGRESIEKESVVTPDDPDRLRTKSREVKDLERVFDNERYSRYFNPNKANKAVRERETGRIVVLDDVYVVTSLFNAKKAAKQGYEVTKKV